MTTKKIEGVKKIAVLRANGLGDYIFAIPALNALDTAYPDTEIVLLGKSWQKDWLKDRPQPVDRVIVVPPMRGVGENDNNFENDEEKVNQFIDEVKREKFDIAIQMHGGGKNSNPVVQKLGAKLTLGLKTPDAIELDSWLPYIYYQPETLRFLELVSLIGARTSKIEPKVVVTENDKQEAKQFIPEGRYIVIHPAATDFRRHWDVKRFAEVGDYFYKKGYKVIVIGTPNESELTDGVINNMKTEGINLNGKLSMNALTGLLSGASLMVANDSGPMHLSAAVGTKTIGIYWCANQINCNILHRHHHIPLLSWITECPKCGNNFADLHHVPQTDCKHDFSWVSKITVEDVVKNAELLLSFP